MGNLVVKGILGLDGEYPLVIPPYTQKEWHEIKVHTGIRPLELEEAWQAGDVDVMAALSWVSLTRGGHEARFVWNSLGEADLFSVVEFDFTDGEEEAEEEIPPVLTPPAGEQGSSGGDGSSGSSTPPLSVIPANPQSPTGTPASDTGAASDLVISAR